MKLIQLNRSGIAHLLLPFIVIIAVASAGVYMLAGSHAASRSEFIDISSPQCKNLDQIKHRRLGFVGLNGVELEFEKNPCLNAEIAKFDKYSLYVGAVYPSTHCQGITPYECGSKAGSYDLSLIGSLPKKPLGIWIDVEAGPTLHWSTPTENAAFVSGLYFKLRGHARVVGFYSNHGHWNDIVGNNTNFPNAPRWYFTGYKSAWNSSQTTESWCQQTIGGKKPVYVQYVATTDGIELDHNYICR